MKKKIVFKASIALLCISIQTTITAAESAPVLNITSGENGLARSPVYEWHYMIKDKKLYKRLYCVTSGEYIGDWIPA